VVEVDTATGQVCPRRLVAVDDVGRVVDDMLVESQVHGSVMQGLGAALFEGVRFDEGGQPITTTFMDYLVPSFALDAPLTVDRLCHPAPSNPLGAKGAGEGGCIGMPPAVLNATLDALRPWVVEELQIPLTPAAVWTALRSAEEAEIR
ncbi:MAG: xanthine dehydrogenase family protein molybdopterin-binding subunit, partial [Actinobacteria bacterium]|nr:xanthine dehydrogenase family protein molybdopterin-binding subunit [Actinomycetota bacterium]NIU69822.1 xanthine dehydrogenase family protein molybdopterin-binding subunit [Actinomycetota bacterium]NIV58101.1 molybdopterin-dependent oxidoreductase [Actinomycetota bacterium]NIV89628.1 molybdopterin-dependent oxidoreductase [Actinomycetota bacterium]NIW31698.1 molybdopterin-dependent oxidoreductase [Actinomycetota bacterium]